MAWVDFQDDDALYRSLQESYDYLFGGSDQPPTVPE